MRIKNLLLTLLILSSGLCFAQKQMAVTFDDLPGQKNTFEKHFEILSLNKELVDKIIQFDIPVIGFVNESKLYLNEKPNSVLIASLEVWLDNGLELGNHTYSHIDLHSNKVKDFEENILKGEFITRGLMKDRNMTLRYFRHPYLHTGESLEVKNRVDSFLKEHGYTVAPVTIDNSEWIYARAYENALAENDSMDADRVVKEYVEYMNDMIRYFETQSDSLFGRKINQILLVHCNKLNADNFDKIAEIILKNGYRFISLDEALTDPAFKHEDEFTGIGGISWIHRWSVTENKPDEFYGTEPEPSSFINELAGIN